MTYGLIADTRETLRIAPDENTAVDWIPVEKLSEICKEPHMLPVYEKVIARMRRWKAMQEQVMAQLTQPLCHGIPVTPETCPGERTGSYRVWLSEIMLQQTRLRQSRAITSAFWRPSPTFLLWQTPNRTR